MNMSARTIAFTAISIALVTVFVMSIPVPIPATGGFTHPGAVAEIFISMAFGPVVGFIAAGVGAAIADLLLGFGGFAPLTLVAHGTLGLLAGLLGWKKGWTGMLVGWVVGGLALVLIYYVGERLFYGYTPANALLEMWVNLGQVGLGLLGILLYELVKESYPQLEQLAGQETFKEME